MHITFQEKIRTYIKVIIPSVKKIWESDKNIFLIFTVSVLGTTAVVFLYVGYVFTALPVDASDKHDDVALKQNSQVQEAISPTITPINVDSTYIYIDVSGAVKNPGMYEMSEGDRIYDVIKKAGGLNELADSDFYARNYNTAKLLHDQDKLYVPRTEEITSGTFVEGTYVIDSYYQQSEQSKEASIKNQSTQTNQNSTSDQNGNKISINSASSSDLQTLSGVGEVTAGNIIKNRPYASINELIDKKIIRSDVYEKNIDLISL